MKQRELNKIRKQVEQEYRSEKATESDFKRQQALDIAKEKRFLQNGGVRNFNSHLLKEKIRKDNEALAADKREKERKADQQRRQREKETRQKLKDEMRQDEEEAIQECRRERLALRKEHVKETREKKLLGEKNKQHEKEERDKLRALDVQHQQELKHEKEKELKAKAKKLKFHKAEIVEKNCLKQREIEKLNKEETETKRVQIDRERVLQQREKEKSEKFTKKQVPKKILHEKLAAVKKQQAAEENQREKQKLSREVAEEDAKVAKRQKDKQEKRAAAEKSIATQRAEKEHENKQKDRVEKEESLDWLKKLKQSDRLSLEEKKQEVNRIRQRNIKYTEGLLSRIAEEQALSKQQEREEMYAARKREEEIAEEEEQFQQYMQWKGKDLSAAQKARHRILLNGEGVPGYFCRETDEPLPKLTNEPTRFTKRYRECNSLQQAMVDVKTFCLPQLPRTGFAVQYPNYSSKDAGEPLATKVNAGARRNPAVEEKIKLYREKDKFKLTNKESSRLTVDLRPTHFPTIKTSGVGPAGRRSPPTGVESALPPITTKNAPAVKFPSSRMVLGDHTSVAGERLPRLATAQTKRIRRMQQTITLL
ncbi:hypothetical protein PBY51_018138 [Eleginops maclovinus]|uniref:Uncharacterized protein n=2 Tax=Eleginops maclovinus TaxID=56733 RepID=A0AAN7XLV7_ELEMC|nr:hypothetical protein PBY51_018138 [Eleginops maclovinus]